MPRITDPSTVAIGPSGSLRLTLKPEFSNLVVDQDLPESTFAFDTSNFQGAIFDERE
jgi:hypothetical protein